MPTITEIAPEVRNNIYFCTESIVPSLLHPDKEVRVPDGKGRELRIQKGTVILIIGKNSVIQPAISQVCKLLRRETLPMYYGNNKFLIKQGCGIDQRKKDEAYVLTWLNDLERKRFRTNDILLGKYFSDLFAIKLRQLFVKFEVRKLGKVEGLAAGTIGTDKATRKGLKEGSRVFEIDPKDDVFDSESDSDDDDDDDKEDDKDDDVFTGEMKDIVRPRFPGPDRPFLEKLLKCLEESE